MLIRDNTPILPVNYMRIFVCVAEQMGASKTELLSDTGVDESILAEREKFITFGQYKKLMLNACRLVKDPSFYLKYGTSINLTEHGKLGHAAFSSSTFEDALKKTIKYIKILNRMYYLDADIQGDMARLKIDTISAVEELYVCEIEQIMSAMFDALKMIPYDSSIVKEMRFKYPEPAHVAAYTALFGDICRFGCKDNMVIFSVKALRENWNYGDPMIEKIAQKNCDDALNQIEGVENLSQQIRDAVANKAGERFPSQEEVAKQLNMTSRTMARYLQKHDTTFQEIIDKQREDMAIQYLQTTTWSIDEIADMLGYSSAANFGRAFKKWTGLPPSEYRLKAL